MFNNNQHTKHIHRIVITLLVITMFGMLNGQTAFAKTLKASIMQAEPVGFLTEDGQVTGLHYDTMKRIVEEAGFAFEAELAPFARVLKQIETGEADLTCMFQNESINKFAIIIVTRSSNRNVVFGHAGTSYARLEDLHGKVVANIRGANYGDDFNNDAKIKKYWTSGYSQNLEMFARNRVDAVVGPELGILYTAKGMGLSFDMFGKPLVLNVKEDYIFLSKKSATDDIVAKLKKAAERLREAGVFEDIQRAYLKTLKKNLTVPDLERIH